jgi:hypothetical protein
MVERHFSWLMMCRCSMALESEAVKVKNQWTKFEGWACRELD